MKLFKTQTKKDLTNGEPSKIRRTMKMCLWLLEVNELCIKKKIIAVNSFVYNSLPNWTLVKSIPSLGKFITAFTATVITG